MTSYVVRRVVQAFLVVLLAFTLTFFLLFVVPGDAAVARLGSEVSLTPAELDALRDEMGLNDPMYVQYLSQLGGILTGDLGNSLMTGQPVLGTILDALPNTFTIAGLALALSLVLGTGLAVLANLTRFYWLRTLLLALPSVGVSVPTFWLGVILLSVFAFSLGWFPSFGTAEGASALVLPVVTLSVVPASMIAQVLAASLAEAQRSPYAYTALTKGASRLRVLLSHCLRNAAIPALTLTGLLTGGLLTGAVITETVYSRSGLGRVILEGVQTVDLTLVQGVVLVCVLTFVTVNLVVDLLYPVVDPRIRRSSRA